MSGDLIKPDDVTMAALDAFNEVHPLSSLMPYDWPDHMLATAKQAIAAAMNAMLSHDPDEPAPEPGRFFIAMAARNKASKDGV